MRGAGQAVLAGLALALVVGGCDPLTAGISADEAVAAAQRHYSFDVADVVAIERGPLAGFIDPREDPQHDPALPVWSIVVRGEFPFECMPAVDGSTDHCPPPATTMEIYIDAGDGRFLFASIPADDP